MREMDFRRRYGVSVGDEELQELRRRMKINLLGAGNGRAEQLALNVGRMPYPLSLLYLEVLLPALQALTTEFEQGKRPFRQTQAAWEVTFAMAPYLYQRRAARFRLSGPPVVIGCVEGNQHVFAVRVIADLLQEAHYPAITPTPLNDRQALLDTVAAASPACVCLSISLTDQYSALLATARALRAGGFTGKIAAGGKPCDNAQLTGWSEAGIDWIGVDVMELIAWLNRHIGQLGFEQRAA